MYRGNESLDLEGVGSDGVDGPPQALDGSVVAGGVDAMDTLADMAAAVSTPLPVCFLQLGLRRWGHRAQPLSRREREIPSSASGGPCPTCRVVTSPWWCSSLCCRCTAGEEDQKRLDRIGRRGNGSDFDEGAKGS